MTHSSYRPDIDGLRAIAVLSVVGFHAFGIQAGFIGVDIFFVISGYLISSILFSDLQQNQLSILDFYRRRVKRIFPALLTVLLFCFALGWFTLLADEFTALNKHIAAGLAFVSNLVLLGESGYFDSASHNKILLHLWSLGIEEQFYIFWPLLLLIFYI
jgi:peptidoglycan/LPS O-acetylase OafA/YrhL